MAYTNDRYPKCKARTGKHNIISHKNKKGGTYSSSMLGWKILFMKPIEGDL